MRLPRTSRRTDSASVPSAMTQPVVMHDSGRGRLLTVDIQDSAAILKNGDSSRGTLAPDATSTRASIVESPVENQEVSQLLRDPNLMTRLEEGLRATGYVGDIAPAMLVYLAFTSRFLSRPLNIILVAPAASGKTAAIEAARRLVPPEAFVMASAASPKALIYSAEVLSHRIVIMAEADSIPDFGGAASIFRSIVEQARTIYRVTTPHQAGGHHERTIEREGPTGLISSSTRSLAYQLRTRVLEINLTTDPDQIRAVLLAQGRMAAEGDVQETDFTAFIELHRWLDRHGCHRVRVPFGEALARIVGDRASVLPERLTRDFGQLTTCIKSVALLHQQQRTRSSDGAVEASLQDYEIARWLLAPVFSATANEGLTPVVRQTVEAVRIGEEITERILQERLGCSKATTSYRVSRAIDGGWLENLQTRNGLPGRIRRKDPLPDDLTVLPSAQELQQAWNASTPVLRV